MHPWLPGQSSSYPDVSVVRLVIPGIGTSDTSRLICIEMLTIVTHTRPVRIVGLQNGTSVRTHDDDGATNRTHCIIIIPRIDMMPSVCIDDDNRPAYNANSGFELDPGYLYPIMPSPVLILVHIVKREDL